jgi:hypothetical protein
MRFLSKSEARIVSAVLVIGILLGSMPLGAGVITDFRPKQPTLTLNICQPVQAALSQTTIPIARPATNPPRFVLLAYGKIPAKFATQVTDLNITPESPPPEAPA